jgi:hypothetical protein
MVSKSLRCIGAKPLAGGDAATQPRLATDYAAENLLSFFILSMLVVSASCSSSRISAHTSERTAPEQLCPMFFDGNCDLAQVRIADSSIG